MNVRPRRSKPNALVSVALVVIATQFVLSCNPGKVKNNNHGSEQQKSADTTVVLDSSSLKNNVNPGHSIYLDTVLNGDAFRVVFDSDLVSVYCNNQVTKVKIYCDHEDKNVIRVGKPGKYSYTNLVFQHSAGIVGFQNYNDLFARCCFFAFRIQKGKLIFLTPDKNTLVETDTPVICEKDQIIMVASANILLLNYHSSRETKTPYYDSTGHYVGQLDGDERYYNFTMLHLQDLRLKTFDVAGTGNEFAMEADYNQLINKAIGYGKK